MSATDELRRMLYERGESWHKWPDDDSTTWQAYSDPHTATESMDGTLIVTGLTPEQAIAATLGVDAKPTQAESSRTCRRLPTDNYDEMCIVRSHGYEREFGYWKCSECGTNCFEGARYCMNCGAKVIG